MGYAVLIVEDETILAKNIKTYLERLEYDVRVVSSAEEGLEQVDAFKPDAILLDFHLPGMDGLEALAKFRQHDPGARIFMLTGHGTVQLAVDAMKAGATEFLTKPVVLGKLKLLLEKALGDERREVTLSYYQSREAAQSGLDRLIGESPPMHALKDTIRRLLESERALADADAPAVLINGETGSGKELVARAMHFDGPRGKGPFVEINCSSIPTHLLESELFGYERGAFTDARERKLGLVEAADGGTLFLDEIGDIDHGLQAKLLKLLEDKSLRRLGSVRDQVVNVRFITATHQPLDQLVREGRFRSDLFYRLRIIHLVVPPLRERGHDVLTLARTFLDLHGRRYGKELTFSPAAERALLAHSWPGNVRELRNIVEQAVLLARGPVIGPEQLPLASIDSPIGGTGVGGISTSIYDIPEEGIQLEQVERELVRRGLEKAGGNVTQAARLLGLTRDTLRYRIEKFGLAGSGKN